jgi:hypothetical protein
MTIFKDKKYQSLVKMTHQLITEIKSISDFSDEDIQISLIQWMKFLLQKENTF